MNFANSGNNFQYPLLWLSVKSCKLTSGTNSATDRNKPWEGAQLVVPSCSVSFHVPMGSRARKGEFLLNVKTGLGKAAPSPTSAIR